MNKRKVPIGKSDSILRCCFSNVRALVIGDILLDVYKYGKVDRISPEAPVPIFKPQQSCDILGGAANVAMNLSVLGCDTTLIGRLGNDTAGLTVSNLCKNKIRIRHLRQKGFLTPVKTRFIVGNNHLLRVDEETVMEADASTQRNVLALLRRMLPDVDIVLISDYGKGLLTRELCRRVISACGDMGKTVIVDPKGCDYSKYANASLVKPNLKELATASGVSFDAQSPRLKEDVISTARSLIRKHGIDGLLVTLSEHGMLYVPSKKGQTPIHLPTQAKEVFDVSGAGDTSLAVLGAALGSGLRIENAMRIANAAAGIAVSKLGTAVVTPEELHAALTSFCKDLPENKIVSIDEARHLCDKHRRHGKTIGFTNGCFDCCHLGHLHSLLEARKFCDILVVGLNSDSWIRAHKGLGRPVQDENTRALLLASLQYVDYVVLFEDETALPLVKALRPDVIAKEGYPLSKWPEGQFVTSYGGKAATLRRIDGYSTTSLLKRMKR